MGQRKSVGPVCGYGRRGGATENARKRKCGTRLQGWKMQEKKMRHKIAGVENSGHENAAPDCRGGECWKRKCGTRLQGWKMQERKMRHKNSGVENAWKVACVIKSNRHKINDKRVE